MKNRKKLSFAILLLAGLITSGCDDLFGPDSNNNNPTGSITVTPSSVTLARGETQQFTSSESYADWSLQGATGSSSINNSGLLTVGTDETASTLTVKATGRYDSSKTGTARVTVAALSATPQGLKASKPGPNSIALSWTAMTGVSQYTVQRSTNGTSFGTIGTATGTTYTDTAVTENASYYYRIQANGVNSQVIYAYAQDYFKMPSFAQRKLIPLANNAKHYYRFSVTSGQSYTIEWQNGSNQNASRNLDVIAYQNNGTQIFSRGYYSYDGYTNPSVFTATATGFVTVEVKNNDANSQNYQIYCYGSEDTSDSGVVALPPYQVNAFKVSSPTQSSITLTWDPVSDAAKYNIYRANTQNGTPGKIGEINSTSYTDNQVSLGGSFWYTIAAVNSDGREGCRFQGAFGIAASHFSLSLYNITQTYSINSGAYQYYRLTVTQGTSYTIEWQNGSNQNASRNLDVIAYQNNGTQIFSRGYYSYDGYTNPSVFTATATGFVTIVIKNNDANSQSYQIYYY